MRLGSEGGEVPSEGTWGKPLPLPEANPPKENENVFNQISRITPYLYLSAATALTSAALAQLRPSLVVNVTPDLPLVPDTASLRLPVRDSEAEEGLGGEQLEAVTRAIRGEAEAGGRVVVHCVAGVSRSATVVIAYLVRYYCSLSAALDHVTTIRPWVRPNTSFLQQLVRWEAAHSHHHQDNLGTTGRCPVK